MQVAMHGLFSLLPPFLFLYLSVLVPVSFSQTNQKSNTDNQPEECGIYHVSCIADRLTIRINETDDSPVKTINYDVRVLAVANMAILDTCYTDNNLFVNVTLTPADVISTLSQCPSPGTVEVNCSIPSGTEWYYGLGEGEGEGEHGCNALVVVPLNETAAKKLEDEWDREVFEEVYREGFNVTSKAGDDWCPKCMKSGVVCELSSANCSCSDGTRTGSCPAKGKRRYLKAIIIGIIASVLGLILLCSSACIMQRKRKQKVALGHINLELDDSGPLISTDFHLMDIATIQAATDNFSKANKLGEGGFGPVYKGILQDGKVIAVKRLSSTSTQGSLEFKNEVRLIAKLQHRNLIRLLGCCVEGEDKLLVYEYLPNGSLDTFLFDVNKRSFLDWRTRLHIIFGISRGLIYLHEDSQLKVIHRDLKASNILLDLGMNSKISDFGLARIFSNDENEANTNRVVGTYGYMAPEFAMEGLFSAKSDVYSYGVLLLEIVSGEKNGRSHLMQYEQSLPKRAWQTWKEGKGLEMIDPFMVASCSTNEALRYIHVGLLCVQENASDRPTMSVVLHMLRNEHMVLQEPKQPPSFMKTNVSIANHSSLGATKLASINEVTLSDFQAR